MASRPGPRGPCPDCGGESRVLDSRPDPVIGGMRRTRQCVAPACRRRFVTHETVADERRRNDATLVARRYLALGIHGRRCINTVLAALEKAAGTDDPEAPAHG